MDFDAVLAKALLLGCRLEDDGRGPHRKVVTPSGAIIPISRSSQPAKGFTDRAYQLMKRLRQAGIDVKRNRASGPVKRIDGDKLLCRETRCANLACPRNQLALETLPASGKAFATFRSKACGFIQLSGCGVVIRRGEEPQLCALSSKHEGRCEPAPTIAPPPPAEETPMLQLAAEAAKSGAEKKRKEKVFATAEQRADAIRRVRAGERRKDVAASLGVSASVITVWMKGGGVAKRKEVPVKPEVVAPAAPKSNGAHPAPVPQHVEPPAPAFALPAPPPQTLFAVDPPMLAVVQVGSETYDLAIPASELVKLVLKYRVSQ